MGVNCAKTAVLPNNACWKEGIELSEVILHLSLTVPVFSFFTSAAPTGNAVAGAEIDCHKEKSLLGCIKR